MQFWNLWTYARFSSIFRSYVFILKCSCGVALPFSIGIKCIIFIYLCIIWKISSPYYDDYVGEELPLSAFCRTSVGEWDAFRSIDMDVEVCSVLVTILLATCCSSLHGQSFMDLLYLHFFLICRQDWCNTWKYHRKKQGLI